MHREPRWWVRQRWWVIYHAQRASLPSSEIAELVGVSTRTVRRVLSVYNQEGPAALDTLGSGGTMPLWIGSKKASSWRRWPNEQNVGN
jgi:hypothetical protein